MRKNVQFDNIENKNILFISSHTLGIGWPCCIVLLFVYIIVFFLITVNCIYIL